MSDKPWEVRAWEAFNIIPYSDGTYRFAGYGYMGPYPQVGNVDLYEQKITLKTKYNKFASLTHDTAAEVRWGCTKQLMTLKNPNNANSGYVPTGEYQFYYRTKSKDAMKNMQSVGTSNGRSSASKQNEESLSEAYTVGYDANLRFVALGDMYYSESEHGLNVFGHYGRRYADRVRYNDDLLETEANSTAKYGDGFAVCSELYGWRNLYTSAEVDSVQNKDLKPGDKDGYIAVYRSGNSIATKECSDYASAKNKSGVLAVFQGKYSVEKGYYDFKTGKVTFCSTITAKWSTGEGYFHLYTNGTVKSKGVTLNTPSFRFFAPKDKNRENAFTIEYKDLDYKYKYPTWPGDEGEYTQTTVNRMCIKMPTANNAAHPSIDIPWAEVDFSSVGVTVEGNTRFHGTFSIKTKVMDMADINVKEIGFGYLGNTGHYTLNGISASGDVHTPKDYKLFGMGGAGVRADIHTFGSRKRFAFEMELEIPQLFEIGAELEVKTVGSIGIPVPNNIQLLFSAAAGIELIPPTVVASITGVEGGIKGLADTLNGDFDYKPNIVFNGGLQGELVKVASGWVNGAFGIGYIKGSVRDFEIGGVSVPVEISIEQDISPEKRSYKNNNDNGFYKFTADLMGMRVKDKLSLKGNFPATSSIVKINGEVELNFFGGIDWKRKMLMYEFDGSGRVKGGIYVPESLFGVNILERWAGVSLYEAYMNAEGYGRLGASWDQLKAMLDIIQQKSHNSNDPQALLREAFKYAGAGFTLEIGGKVATVNWSVKLLLAERRIRAKADGIFINKTKNIYFGAPDDLQPMVLGTGQIGDYDYVAYMEPTVRVLGSTASDGAMAVTGDADEMAKYGVSMTQLDADGKAYRVSLSDSAEAENLLFICTTKDGMTYTPDELRSLVRVVKPNGSEYELKFYDYKDGVRVDSYGDAANAFCTGSAGGGWGIDEEGNFVEEMPATPYGVTVLLDGSGDWLLEAGKAIDIKCVYSIPTAEIDAKGILRNIPAEGKYELRAYMVEGDGTEVLPEDSFHTIASVEITAADNGKRVEDVLKVEDANAVNGIPSGSYRLLYRLVEIEENIEIEYDDGETGVISAAFNVGEQYLTSRRVSNTNPDQLPDPTGVTASDVGNETMHVSWTAPEAARMPEGKTIDGYTVSIEQLMDGEWVNTGSTVIVEADGEGNIPTEVDIAITVHGELEDKNMLAADQTYRAVVRTGSNCEVGEDDNGDGQLDADEIKTMLEASPGTRSNETRIKKMTPPTIVIDPAPVYLTDENGDYVARLLYVKAGDEIKISTSGDPLRSLTVTPLAEGMAPVSLDVSGGVYTVPEYEGTLMIEVLAQDTDGDYAVQYVSLRYDDVEPMVTVDRDAVLIDSATREFTVTGFAEPYAALAIASLVEGVELEDIKIKHTEDGSFSITAKVPEGVITEDDGKRVILYFDNDGEPVTEEITLPEEERNNKGSILLSVTAVDKAGNMGADMTSAQWGVTLTEPPAQDPTDVPFAEGEPDGYEITLQAAVNGSISASHDRAAENEKVTLRVTPAGGYEIDSVRVLDGSGAEVSVTRESEGVYSFTMPAANVTAAAVFKEIGAPAKEYTVTVSDGTASAAKAKAGDRVTITAASRPGYVFDRWNVMSGGVSLADDRAARTSFIMPAADVVIEAAYKASSFGGYGEDSGKPLYRITVEQSENGRISVKPTSAEAGEKVIVTVTPDSGYAVESVRVTDSNGREININTNSDGTYSFTMPAGRVTVTASFAAAGHDCPSAVFKDVDVSRWYHESVDYVVANGLMRGVSADTFDVSGTLNRAMLVTVLHRLEGEPAASGASPYTDVAEGQWYTAAVIWADKNGIVKGFGNGRFKPLEPITREQIAAVLYRYSRFKGYDVSAGEETNILSYEDALEISEWAFEPMQWANAEGLITGRSESQLAPRGNATRAEIAEVLTRFCKKFR
ncbi:MAG: S-layer homology domain-containing protein [Clostridia bacterium]|nr:S-layer homology domain-containing protein [Clostridia bacterium]